MTKAEIVNEIVIKTGIDKVAVQAIVEALMTTMKNSMIMGENIYFRGFGSFIIKKRAEKTGRNIRRKPQSKFRHTIFPRFKPNKEFMEEVKIKVRVK